MGWYRPLATIMVPVTTYHRSWIPIAQPNSSPRLQPRQYFIKIGRMNPRIGMVTLPANLRISIISSLIKVHAMTIRANIPLLEKILNLLTSPCSSMTHSLYQWKSWNCSTEEITKKGIKPAMLILNYHSKIQK